LAGEDRMSGEKRGSFGSLGRAEPLHLKVAALILREIEGGQFKPGDRLPTEHDLATAFDVSRNVIREAIACLRADGVIDSRQGLGAFVLPPEDRQSIRIDATALRDTSNVRGLFELRSILEIQSAGMAALRRTDSQLRDIAEALESMSGAEKWSAAGIDADLAFHHRVAMATGNDYIVTFLRFIAQTMRETILEARQANGLQTVVEVTIAEHRPIYDAIARQDEAGAKDAMRHHIAGAAGRLGIEL